MEPFPHRHVFYRFLSSAVTLIAILAAADWIGRLCSGRDQLAKRQDTMLSWSFLRWLILVGQSDAD